MRQYALFLVLILPFATIKAQSGCHAEALESLPSGIEWEHIQAIDSNGLLMLRGQVMDGRDERAFLRFRIQLPGQEGVVLSNQLDRKGRFLLVLDRNRLVQPLDMRVSRLGYEDAELLGMETREGILELRVHLKPRTRRVPRDERLADPYGRTIYTW